MKKILYYFIGMLFTVSLAQAQQRGDVKSYELIADWSVEELRNKGAEIVTHVLEEATSLPIPVSSSLLNVIGELNVAVKVYRVYYYTPNFNGQLIVATGAVLVPQMNCRLPIATYNHGTVFKRQEVPSYLSGAGEGIEFMYPLLFSGSGYLTVAPDYQGLGDGEGFHPFVDARTEAAATLDNVRAARHLSTALNFQLNGEVFLTGYSQGGHATMATLKEINDHNRSEFNVVMAAPGSGPYDLYDLEFNYMFTNPAYSTPQYGLYAIASCQYTRGTIYSDIHQIIKPEYSDLYTSEILGQTGNVEWIPTPWTDMLQPEFLNHLQHNPNHPFRSCLKESNNYDWDNSYLTYYFYTTGDEQVDYRQSIKAIDAQRNRVPWWRFWDKAKIQGRDIGLFGKLAHSYASIPAMLAARVEFNLRSTRCTDQLQKKADSLQTIEEAELAAVNGFQVYPNPIKDEAQIALNNPSDEINRVYLRSTSGVYSVELEVHKASGIYSIQRKGIAPGLYILEIETNKGDVSRTKVWLD